MPGPNQFTRALADSSCLFLEVLWTERKETKAGVQPKKESKSSTPVFNGDGGNCREKALVGGFDLPLVM